MGAQENKIISDLRNEKDYYKGLSEIYYYRAEEGLKGLHSISVIMGCIMEMESDLIKYKKDFGATDAFVNSTKRVSLMLDQMDKILKISTDNLLMREHLKKQRMQIAELENKLLDTVKKSPNEI